MSKAACVFLFLVIGACPFNQAAIAQASNIDSLKLILRQQATASLKVKAMLEIGAAYEEKNIHDTALTFGLSALKLAEATGDTKSIFTCLNAIAHFNRRMDNFEPALEFASRAKTMAEQDGNKQNLNDIYNFISVLYLNNRQYDSSLAYAFKEFKIAEDINSKKLVADAEMAMADAYSAQKKIDKALQLYNSALKLANEANYWVTVIDLSNAIGLLNEELGDFAASISSFSQAIGVAKKSHNGALFVIGNITGAYYEEKKYDSALYFAKSLLAQSLSQNIKKSQAKAYWYLQLIYEAEGNYAAAYSYLHSYTLLADSLNSAEQRDKVDFLQAGYKASKQEKQIELLEKNSRLQGLLRNVLIVTAFLLLVTAFLTANRYFHKKKSAAALAFKNNELVTALGELKATQAQLIQSEKMASLGELTAGIAHEIQNPLNFVNNFSEVSNELVDELLSEKAKLKSERDEQLEVEILSDIKANLEKINHHGKRADAIVKGMLQHSRKSTGQKEPTDINKLAEEYLRLSYQGLRAKDKAFNASIQTSFDKSIGQINIVPQDIGRVLLNLFNNAFYAVGEKAKTAAEGYQPTVSVSTKKEGDKAIITVADNGSGIPAEIADKIFQPFFTTKPTGQGTGLGLSLSYDIVKAHGGEIRVQTKEGEGATLIIQLPIGIKHQSSS